MMKQLDLFLEKKNAVLTSWDSVDVVRDYRAEPFVGDVRELQEKANKGMILLRVLLDAGLDYSNADLWVRLLFGFFLWTCRSRNSVDANEEYSCLLSRRL